MEEAIEAIVETGGDADVEKVAEVLELADEQEEAQEELTEVLEAVVSEEQDDSSEFDQAVMDTILEIREEQQAIMEIL